MGNKKTFIMYKGWDEMLRALPNEDLGIVMKSVLAYQDGEDEEVDNPVLNAIALLLKAQMRTDEAEYEATCEKRREAGEKGGKATQSKNKQKVASASNNQANQADNDNEYDNDNEKDKKKIIKENPTEGMSNALAAAASDWLTYKNQRKDKLTDIGIQKLMTQIRNAASEYGEDRVIQVINKSMGAGYQGIVWDWLKNKSSPKPVNTFPSRRYDFAALERGDMASG